MTKTKKVGASGRFGVRCGSSVRARWASVEAKRKAKQKCPLCLRLGCKRLAKGLWKCPKCGKTFTAGAYALIND
jgi:large subunit ribosomal protein L37Ae